MRRFKVTFELANHDDMVQARNGRLNSAKVRRVRLNGIVNSGAARLVLPATVVKQLGLEAMAKIKVRRASGRIGERNQVNGV
jgi:hypothetical protein